MYSGTTLRSQSGNVLGAHQKIDRVARKYLTPHIPEGINFPSTREILLFEGNNGPDGIKAKSPARDEPWHYIDPTDDTDTGLLVLIDDHMANLTTALADDNHVRAAFEAAWLAHAIVDGLTPAHHYPLEDKIEELWGYPKDQRLTIKQKNIIVGENRRDTVSKNWQYWGAKGVFTTHFMFEFGFATTISSMKFKKDKPNPNDRIRAENEGIIPIFLEAVQSVYHLGMYETFYKQGWTQQLARQTRVELAPTIIRTVNLAWYVAAKKAAQKKKERNQ